MVWNIIAAVITIVSAGISYVEARKAKKEARRAQDASRGVLLNRESNIQAIPVIYGEMRVGGVRTILGTRSGVSDTNEFLYMVLQVCEGEVESITNIQFDDIPITDARFSGLVSTQVFLGSDTQSASSLLEEWDARWTSDHIMQGVAYIAIRLKWNEDAFSGIPDVTALVKGRKVYDPRTDTTAWSDNPALCLRDYLLNNRFGKGLNLSEIDDTAFAQAANDCEESVVYYEDGDSGQLFTCNMVLDTEREVFENIPIFLSGCRGFFPYTQGQYSLIIDGSRSSVLAFTPREIIGGIQIRGESKGNKYNRVQVRFINPDANWQEDVAIWPPAGSAEESQFLAEDGGELLQEDIELETITNFYQARDLARVICLRSRNALRVQFRSTSEALNLTVADVVTVSHPTPAWNAKPFQVEEISLNADGTCDVQLLEYDSTIYTWETGTVQAQYPDTNLPNPFFVSPPSNLQVVETTVLANDGTLLPALRVTWDAPADSFVSRYEVQWLRSSEVEDYGLITDNFTEQEDWGAIDDAATEVEDYGLIITPVVAEDPDYSSAFVTPTQHVIRGVEPFGNYNIRVRAINALGAKSAFISTASTPAGDTTPPGPVSSLTAVGGLKEITLTWINPSDTDFKNVEIFENTVNNFASSNRIAVTAASIFNRTGLDYNVTRYYWVVAVDFSGNRSEVSAGVSATTLFVDVDAFSQAVMDLFSEAGAFGIEPVSALPAFGDFDGQIKYRTTDKTLWRWDADTAAWTDDIFSITEASVTAASFAAGIEPVGIVSTLPSPVGYTGVSVVFLTTDSKLYRYNSSVPEFTTLIPASDISGQIQTTQITDGGITTPKLDTNAVTADKISANAVTVGKVAAGAISTTALQSNIINSTHIQAGSIQTDRIAAGSITGGLIAASGVITTAAQINDAVITNAKIQNLAVTTAKINDLAVSTIKIADQAVTIPSSAFTADSTASIPWDGGAWVTVQSLTWTSTGAPAYLSFSFKGIDSFNTAPFIRYRLTGTGGYTQEFGQAAIEVFPGVAIAGAASHTFSAGSVTVNLQVAPTTSLGNVRASHRSLLLIETKK